MSVPRRVDKHVALLPLDQVRMGTKRRTCVIAAAVHPRGDLLRKQARRLLLMALCSNRRRWTKKRSAQSRSLFIFSRWLTSEDGLACPVHDQPRCDFP